MQDVYTQFLSYVMGVWRRRWYVIALAWLFCGAGWTYVAGLPDRYESSARIYVDMDSMLGPLMKGLTVEINMGQQIAIMQRTLLSRPNLEKVMLLTDMDLAINDETEKDAALEELGRKITIVRQGRNLNLFDVKFTDTDPERAKRVVQAVLQIFVEGNVGASRKDMDTTRRFLDAQLQEYEIQLVAAEERLADFKRKNMGFLPGGGNYYAHMQDVRARVQATQSELGQSQSVRRELNEQLKSVPQFLVVSRSAAGPGPMGSGPESLTEMRVVELERTLDGLKTRFTDRHPDVVATQRQLDMLRKEQEKQRLAAIKANEAANADSGPISPTTQRVPNPVYEQLKLQIIQQEASVAALRDRLTKEQSEVQRWTRMAGLVPKVEAELVKLTRDYEIIKNNYEQLRQRKESAKFARDLETKANKVQFRIIDPPQVPLAPVGPNRSLFMSVVLLAGIAGGIGFAFLLSQINATFPTVESLRNRVSFPVLGSVTTVTSPQERMRAIRELTGFGLVSACLLVAFGGILVIQSIGTEALIENVRQLGII
jgi:polysaccharide chain length determinant protein (PEP-CTERM system associated)